MSVIKTPEIVARQEMMAGADTVRVSVRAAPVCGVMVPDPEGPAEVEAVFKVMTFGDNAAIEKACQVRVDDKATGEKYACVDIHEARRLALKRSLLSWTIPVPIEREGGWMTKGSYERVSRVSAPLLDALMCEFEASSEVSDEEAEQMSRQAAILFSPNSRGVSEACEAVSLFCNLGNFWEKFGMDRRSIADLPMREYAMLRAMLSKEGAAQRVVRKPPPGGTQVAGSRGRARPSTVRVPM